MSDIDMQTDLEGAAIATGLTVEFAVSEGQILKFTTYLKRDDALSVYNDHLDKVVAAGERQRNKAQLAKCRENIIRLTREIELAQVQQAEAEKRYQAETIERQEAERELTLTIANIEEGDRAEFAHSGKRGDWKLSQRAAEKLRPLRTMLARLEPDQEAQDKVRADMQKAIADRVMGHMTQIETWERDIVRYEELLSG